MKVKQLLQKKVMSERDRRIILSSLEDAGIEEDSIIGENTFLIDSLVNSVSKTRDKINKRMLISEGLTKETVWGAYNGIVCPRCGKALIAISTGKRPAKFCSECRVVLPILLGG